MEIETQQAKNAREEQEAIAKNRAIAKEGSWMCSVFQEHNLTLEDKREILFRLRKKLHIEDLKAYC